MNEQRPKISFICCFHKKDEFFDAMLQSLLSQDYDYFDIILVDDSGDDNVLDPTYSQQKKIKLVKNRKKMGLTHSLNKGISCSGAEYIARIDRGDWCYPNRLSQQVEFMLRRNLDICGSFVEEIDESNDRIRTYRPPLEHTKIVASLEKYNCLIHSSLMIKKDVLMNLNMYDERFKYAQDYDLCLRAVAGGYKLGVINKILVKRRLYKDSITVTRRKSQILHATAALIFYYVSVGKINYRISLNIFYHFSKLFIPDWLRQIKRKIRL